MSVKTFLLFISFHLGLVAIQGCTSPMGDPVKTSLASLGSLCPSSKSTGVAQPFLIYHEDERTFLEQTPFVSFGPSLLGLVPSSILDDDNRVTRTLELGETMNLCPEERLGDIRSIASCTGILIGGDIALTAGHCVPNQAACDENKFVFNLSGANANRSAYAPDESDIFSCSEILYTAQNSETDLAIIRLDRQAEGRRQFAINLTETVQLGEPLTCIGHSESLPLMVSPEGSYQGSIGGYFLHDLDIFGGNSGAPIFAGDTVIGLHSGRVLPHYFEDTSRNCQVRVVLETSPEQESVSPEVYYSQAADTHMLREVLRDDVEVLSGRVFKISQSGVNMVIEGFACALTRPEALEVSVHSATGTREFLGSTTASLSLSSLDEDHCQSGASHEFRIEVPASETVELSFEGGQPGNSLKLQASLNPTPDCGG